MPLIPLFLACCQPDEAPPNSLSSQYSYKDYVMSNNYFSVVDLPVFGAETTVSGRTLRYTYGNTRTCVPLLPPISGANITILRAAFAGRDVGGNVFFVSPPPPSLSHLAPHISFLPLSHLFPSLKNAKMSDISVKRFP